MELAYFLDMIFTNGYEKNGFWYFKINLQLLSIWVSETDGDTAYAYSRLVNSLYNKDKALHHQFSQMICWSKLLSAIIEDNGQHLYSWGQLINRLTVSYSKDERETLSSQLDPAIQKLLPSVNTRNIDGMSSFLSDVATLIPHQVSVVIEALLPQYEQYFKEDSSKALHILDFNFLLYVCGLSLLGGHRATEDEKTASSLLVSAVPEREFGNVITNCEPRLWNQFYNVMILISKYDSEKARKIVEYINFETLSKRAEDYWNRERSDIFPLCFGLYLGSRKNAEQFISKNKALIHRFLICYTCVAPACSIQAFRDGIPVDIIGGYSWRLTYFTFKELLLHDEQTANEILHTNIMKIADKINRLSEIDFDDVFCLKFLRLIQSKNHSAYVDVLAGLDATVISKKWPKSFYPQRTKRDKTERYRSFLNHLCDNVTSVDVKNELIEIKKCLSTNKSNNIENHPVDTEP